MVYACLIVLIFCLRSGCGLACIGLLIALDLFLNAFGVQANTSQYLIFTLLLLVIPVSAFIIGACLDRAVLNDQVALNTTHAKSFSLLAIVAAFYLALQSNYSFAFLERVLHVSGIIGDSTISLQSVSIFVSSLGSAALFCISLVTLALFSVVLLFELPLLWLNRAHSSSISLDLRAFRPLILIATVSLVVNLILGFFFETFWTMRF